MSNDDATTMKDTEPIAKPRVFIDADVLIAGSGSTTGASYILLHLSDLTIIEGVISEQVKREAERNLLEKLPQALPAFRLLLESAVRLVDDPAAEEVARFEDTPIPRIFHS